jgi:DNA-binding HxlR family transcriptional regulator
VRAQAASPRVCNVARTLGVIGEKWALLAIREAFFGNGRFDEMVRLTGAPRDTMAARLRGLVAAGILERVQYCEHPARYEYVLTDAGRDLYPVILTLQHWGDVHLSRKAGLPRPARHDCGEPLVPRVVCEACGETVDGFQMP